MIQKISDLEIKDFSGGLNTVSDIFTLKPNETPDAQDVKFNLDGSMEKRSGYVKRNTVHIGSGGWGIFDYGVANLNNILVATGTGVYYSTDLGATYTMIQSSKSAARTYFNRIKDYAIYTDDAYDYPYYWTGSASQMQIIAPNSGPACRFSLDYQGFGLFMNWTSNTLRIYYQDANTLLSGPYQDFFTLAPAERSDQITGGTVLNNKAYIFTKYQIFRLTYVGGNPDFAYTPVKSFGFVPGAWNKVSIGDAGEVVVGLCFDKRIRLFDGGDDKIISDKIEFDNGISNFHLIDIQDNAIEKSNSVRDTNEQVWKLNLCMAPSNHPTHTLCLDLRSLGFYLYSYSSPLIGMTMTESANKQYLVSINTQGNVYQMGTSNTDAGSPINDYYSSPFIYEKSPAQVNKTNKVDFFFAVTSANNVYMEDRVNFSTEWKLRDTYKIEDDATKNQLKKTTDLPTTFNTYQYKLSSSSGTAEAWKLNRADILLNSKGFGG